MGSASSTPCRACGGERRLWPGSPGRGGRAADAHPALLQRPDHDRAGHGACGASRRAGAGAVPHVFFTGSGSEANDTVIRLVRRYWDLVGAAAAQGDRLALNAYHGSTLAAASLGGMAGMHAQGGLPIPHRPHRPAALLGASRGRQRAHPRRVRPGRGAGWRRRLRRSAPTGGRLHRRTGSGRGRRGSPPSSYWPEIQRICDRHGILLVSDEVVCGFGRTGQWWLARPSAPRRT